MTTLITPTAERSRRTVRLRSWQTAAGLAAIAAGAAIVTGTLLPWVETFAGLIGIPGIRGTNGRLLAAAGCSSPPPGSITSSAAARRPAG